MKTNVENIIICKPSEKYLGDERVKWCYENLYGRYKDFEVKLEDNKVVIYGDIVIPSIYEKLEYKIDEVYGDVIVDNIIGEYTYGYLTTLENFPTIIHGDFICKQNLKLTSLKGGPEEVYGDFICAGCKLESLEYMPKIVKHNFYVYNNNIKDLSPILESTINGVIDVQFNPCENSSTYSSLLKQNKLSTI